MKYTTEPLILDTAVVGSGAAGYSAALRLCELGVSPVAILTEGVTTGTSRNTGSDKQTYYKLSLSGGTPDSPFDMAHDLFAGGCVDGDNALCEAALSTRCFLRLCELGVPFPTDEYGQYVGYKTDHDPAARATSAGPLTSKLMTEALERAVTRRGIPVRDRMTVVRILKDGDGAVCGLIALDSSGNVPVLRPVLCRRVVWATGGPAGIYADTVYPVGHTGTTGVPLEAGAAAQNLTEWQYGLASVSPRWNVSGTYMQVLPRMISVDSDGTEREFLTDAFPTSGDALSALFLKGYQWPFDCRRTDPAGARSSLIDLLVYRETVLMGRRVYLDYTRNPGMAESVDYASLFAEARDYLTRAGACFGRPIDRLLHMNAPAVELYRSKGVDLAREPLEIALCAQHNNGGLSVDSDWRSTVPGLYVCGEAAGTHGVTRPGGSALNAGQVGALRCAEAIAAGFAADARCPLPAGEDCPPDVLSALRETAARLSCADPDPRLPDATLPAAAAALDAARARMSRAGAALREASALREALDETDRALAAFPRTPGDPLTRFRLRDTLLTQKAYLAAMLDYADAGLPSRGSSLVLDPFDPAARVLPVSGLDLYFRAPDASRDRRDSIQTVSLSPDETVRVEWRPVRPLPAPDEPFETVWRAYREKKHI